jgi:hypothetical protein
MSMASGVDPTTADGSEALAITSGIGDSEGPMLQLMPSANGPPKTAHARTRPRMNGSIGGNVKSMGKNSLGLSDALSG